MKRTELPRSREVASSACRLSARNPIYNYNTPGRDFSGLFNGLLKYMGWALAFCLVQSCSHESIGKGIFFGSVALKKNSLVSAEPNGSAAGHHAAWPGRHGRASICLLDSGRVGDAAAFICF
jgi:hypothetical protein